MDPWFCVLCQFIIPFVFWEVIYVQVLFSASFPLKFRVIFFLVLFIRAYPAHCLFLACFFLSPLVEVIFGLGFSISWLANILFFRY